MYSGTFWVVFQKVNVIYLDFFFFVYLSFISGKLVIFPAAFGIFSGTFCSYFSVLLHPERISTFYCLFYLYYNICITVVAKHLQI